MPAFLWVIFIVLLGSIAVGAALYYLMVERRKNAQVLIDENSRNLRQLMQDKSKLSTAAQPYMKYEDAPFTDLYEMLEKLLEDLDRHYERLVEKRTEMVESIPEAGDGVAARTEYFFKSIRFWNKFNDKFDPVKALVEEVEEILKEGWRLIQQYEQKSRQVRVEYQKEQAKHTGLRGELKELTDAGLAGKGLDAAKSVFADLGEDLERTGENFAGKDENEPWPETDQTAVEAELQAATQAQMQLDETVPKLDDLRTNLRQWRKSYRKIGEQTGQTEKVLEEIEMQVGVLPEEIDETFYQRRYDELKRRMENLQTELTSADVKQLEQIERGTGAVLRDLHQVSWEMRGVEERNDQLLRALAGLENKLARIIEDIEEWKLLDEHPIALDRQMPRIEKVQLALEELMRPGLKRMMDRVEKHLGVVEGLDGVVDDISDKAYLALSERKDLMQAWRDVKDARRENLEETTKEFLEKAEEFKPVNWEGDGLEDLLKQAGTLMRRRDLIFIKIRQPNLKESELQTYASAADTYLGDRSLFLERIAELEEKLGRLQEAHIEASAVCMGTGNLVISIRNVVRVDPYLMEKCYGMVLEHHAESRTLYQELSAGDTAVFEMHKRIKLWDQEVHLHLQEAILAIKADVQRDIRNLKEKLEGIQQIAALNEEVVLNEASGLLEALEGAAAFRLGEDIDWQEASYPDAMSGFSGAKDRVELAVEEVTREIETDLMAEYKTVTDAKVSAQARLEKLAGEARFSSKGYWPPTDVSLVPIERIAEDCESALDALKAEGINMFYVSKEFARVIERYQKMEEDIETARQKADQQQGKIQDLEQHLKQYQEFFAKVAEDFKDDKAYDEKWIELMSREASHKKIQAIIAEYQRGKISYSEAYNRLQVIDQFVVKSIEDYKANEKFGAVFEEMPVL